MAGYVDGGSYVTLVCGASALSTENVRVKLHTDGTVIVSGADEPYIGTVFRTAAVGDPVVIRTFAGKLKGVASEAVDIGDFIYPAASGKISDTVALSGPIGQALTAAAADGDTVEYFVVHGGSLSTLPTLPTSEPATVGSLWTNSLVVTVSNGP